MFKVQTDIAEHIAKALLNELTPEKKAKLNVSKPANIEAYEFYLRGIKIHYDKYLGSLAVNYFNESERFLLKAILIDPNYAEAYGALADLYDTRTSIQADQSKYWALRDSVIRIAYRMNPNSVQTLLSYGYSFMRGEKPNLDSSFYFFKRAYHQSPDEVRTNTGIADFYTEIGLHETAKPFWQQALNIDPLNKQSYYNLGVVNMFLGAQEEAKRAYEKVLEWENDAGAHYWLGYLSLLQRNRTEALRHIETIKQINPEYYRLNDLQAMLLAADGRKTEALKMSVEPRVLSMLRMKKEFLSQLDAESKDAANTLNPDVLLKEPQFEFVRDDPTFKIILEKVSESYEARLSKYGKVD